MGRIFDLSIIGHHFKSYEDLAKFPDCKYAFDVNWELTALVRRVETLNLVGRMLWPNPMVAKDARLPVTLHEWLVVAADVFLMRYISVLDCALIVANTVYEAALPHRECTVAKLQKKSVSKSVIDLLSELQKDQGELRTERNARFHHGDERQFTGDDQTFRIAALHAHWGGGVAGKDRNGRRIDIDRYFKEGLVELQRDFNRVTRRLARQLDRFYDMLSVEFEARFVPRFRAGPFGQRS